MPSAFRDPKSLPDWIELDYCDRPRPLRRRRWVVGWVVLLLTVGLLGLAYWWGNRRLYQGGPVSNAHQMFNNDCASCHTQAFQTARRLLPENVAFRSVSDDACQHCHPGAVHHAEQMPAAGSERCADCHPEHLGRAALSLVPDRHCLTCHEDLKRNDGKPSPFANLASFGTHPEFTWHRTETKRPDPGTIRFNHAVHLAEEGVYRPDAKQLELLWEGKASGEPVRTRKVLNCQDCHKPDASGRFMEPIAFDQHCKECHGLPIRIAGAGNDPADKKAIREFEVLPVAHPRQGQSPAVVRAELRDRYTHFIQKHPEVLRRESAGERPFPGWERNRALNREEHDWVQQQVANAWRILIQSKGGCAFCHQAVQVGSPAAELPAFAPANITRRWLPHGQFSHQSHRLLDCAECHAARTSTETSDVLLPSIASCQKCHNPSVGVRSDCVECHRYHDREKERAFTGKRTIDESLSGK